jgi:hypothetical protein
MIFQTVLFGFLIAIVLDGWSSMTQTPHTVAARVLIANTAIVANYNQANLDIIFISIMNP